MCYPAREGPISGDRNISTTTDSKQNRRNLEIRVPRVRVIGSDGEMLGVLTRDEALAIAQEEELYGAFDPEAALSSAR